MGGKSGPPAPQPMSYKDSAKLVRDQSREQQKLLDRATMHNRPDQVNPWGRSTWTQTKDGSWQQRVKLSPEQRRLYNRQTDAALNRAKLGRQITGRMGDEFRRPVDTEGLAKWRNTPYAPDVGRMKTESQYLDPQRGGIKDDLRTGSSFHRLDASGIDRTVKNRIGETRLEFDDSGEIQRSTGADADALRNRAEDAIYDRAASRLDPQTRERRAAVETQLAAQGLTPGTPAYDRAMANLDRAESDAYAAARQDAIIGGGREASRQFDIDLSRGRFANEAQRQAYLQDLGRADFRNRAAEQRLDMALDRGQFQNEAQRQRFVQDLAQRENQQDWHRDRMEFINRAQQQQWAQDMALRQQQMDYNQARTGDWNQARDMRFHNQLDARNFNNRLRQAQLGERTGLRGQRLNEMNAMLSGQQVGMPQFGGFAQAQAAQAPDYLGAQQQAYNQQANAFSVGQQQRNNFMGGLFGLGSSIFSGGLF